MASQCSSWSDLPQVILELIFDCAKDPIDIIRCGAVCKSWLPSAIQVFRKFLRLCLILDGIDKGSARVLFNLLTKETRMIQVPEANEKWVGSVCNRWLIVVDSKSPYRIQLLNVFSPTQIDLPPLTSSSIEPTSLYPPFIGGNFHCKLLLSKCPLNSDCILFLLHGTFLGFHTISSWKPGQTNWSNSEVEYRKIYDAILYKGKLYATIYESTDTDRTFLVIYNYQLELEAVVLITEVFYGFNYEFLVKSFNDDCLLVGVCSCGGKSVEIFEFDFCLKKLKKVNDLGGCALFLGRNPFLAKAGDLETWFKANCIYFFSYWDSKEYDVYDLETRNLSIVPCQFVGKATGPFGELFLNFDV